MNENAYVDSELLERAMKLSGESSASSVLTKALEEYIARRSPNRIVGLAGKFEWDTAYDYKRERSRS